MVKKSSRVSDSMVKKHGTKRKIPIEKITKKESLAVAYTKRTGGLYSKVSQLCLLNRGSQIAILATPPSSESNVSFYSFGHTSVDAIVSAYLSGQQLAPVSSETLKQMREDKAICMAQQSLGLGFWWEEEISETREVLTDTMNSMRKLMTGLEGWGAEEVINTLPDEDIKFGTQELNLQPSDFVIDTLSDEDIKFWTQKLDLQPSDYLNETADTEVVVSDDDLNAAFNNNNTEEQDQFQAICDSFCVTDNNHTSTLPTENFDEWSNNQQEMDSEMIHSFLFDDVFPDNARQELVDGVSMMDSSLFSDFNIVEDGAFLCGLDQDDLSFFDGFSELTSVAAL